MSAIKLMSLSLSARLISFNVEICAGVRNSLGALVTGWSILLLLAPPSSSCLTGKFPPAIWSILSEREKARGELYPTRDRAPRDRESLLSQNWSVKETRRCYQRVINNIIITVINRKNLALYSKIC